MYQNFYPYPQEKQPSAKVSCLCTAFCAISLKDSTVFQNYLGQQHIPSLFSMRWLHIFLIQLDCFVSLLSIWGFCIFIIIFKFAYIKPHALLCKILWLLKNAQFHVFITTVSYEIFSLPWKLLFASPIKHFPSLISIVLSFSECIIGILMICSLFRLASFTYQYVFKIHPFFVVFYGSSFLFITKKFFIACVYQICLSIY